MIDMHTHVLPFVDDGSESLENSIKMVRVAREQGVTDMFLTPHYRVPYTCPKEHIEHKFKEFCEIVKQRGIDINLYLGREIKLDKFSKNLLENNRLLTMNGSKYVLVEFNLSLRTDKEDVVDAVYGLKKAGFIPIVAHFERYAYADVDKARDIKRAGGLIQINATAVMGRSGFKCKRRAYSFLERGLVDFVASDAHEKRHYYMDKAFNKISHKFGVDIANELFVENAKTLLMG